MRALRAASAVLQPAALRATAAAWMLALLAQTASAQPATPVQSAPPAVVSPAEAPLRASGAPSPAIHDAAGLAAADSTLSFELADGSGSPVGWRVNGEAVLDDTVALDGARSLRLSAGDGARAARATLRITPPAAGGNRIRIAAHVMTDGVPEGIDLLLRIDGPDGLIYVDRRRAAIEGPAHDGWSPVDFEAPVFESATRLDVAVSVDRGTVWLDAFSVNVVSTESLPPPSAAAARYVEYALDLIDAHSMYRAALDWPRYRSDVLAQARGARTPADAHLAVRYAIGRLGDLHGYLRAPDRAEALDRAPVSNARTGRPPVAPEGRVLPGGIPYLTVPGFAGGQHMQQVEFAEALQGLIRSLDSPAACGWIVDLRSNSGGNLWPMLLGLGPLIGDGDAVVATYPDGRRETVWYRDGKAGLGEFARLRVRGEPHRLNVADARVAVLVGSRTASAAEVLAMAFRGVDGRRSFGAETDGMNTGTRTFVLSDGAQLVLAVVTLSDRTGRVYRGPIQPDMTTPVGPRDRPLLEQSEVRAALDWLAAGC